MNKIAFVFIPFSAVLIGCSTPLEQCVSDASQEYFGLTSAADVAQQNISRGYAIHKQTVPYTYEGVCYYNSVSYSCPKTGYRTQETPVSVNISEERKRLAYIRKQLPAAERRRNAATKQCSVQYPA